MDYPTFPLEARSITKSFGPTSVLKGFDLSIAPSPKAVALQSRMKPGIPVCR